MKLFCFQFRKSPIPSLHCRNNGNPPLWIYRQLGQTEELRWVKAHRPRLHPGKQLSWIHSPVLQPEISGIPQIHDDSPFNSLSEDASSFISNHSLNNKINLLRFDGFSEPNEIINRHLDFPSNLIISILQKKNHWHQSSEDEPSPHIYS